MQPGHAEKVSIRLKSIPSWVISNLLLIVFGQNLFQAKKRMGFDSIGPVLPGCSGFSFGRWNPRVGFRVSGHQLPPYCALTLALRRSQSSLDQK
jgi:hypothetical protein